MNTYCSRNSFYLIAILGFQILQLGFTIVSYIKEPLPDVPACSAVDSKGNCLGAKDIIN